MKIITRSHLPQLLFIILFAGIGSYFLINSLAASNPNIYIAQSAAGAANGTDCADAYPVSFFNTSTNWGTGSTQIGPGTTVHLCGTVTAAMNFQGDGSSGNPVTLHFEANAKISMPVCPGRGGGCLNLDNRSYVTVDGGTNGIIESTANGTHLANHSGSYGINAWGCNNCEVKNLTIQNIYVHDGSADYTEIDQTQVRAIDFFGSNFLFHDNTVHDVGWAITFGGDNEQNERVYNNNIYNIDHGITPSFNGNAVTTGPIYIYNNHIHDMGNWDTTSNAYHHDGIHCYSGTLGSNGTIATVGEQINGMYIYDNRFDGQVGGHATAWIFLEGGTNTGQTPCATSSSAIYIFNNLLTSTDDPPANTYMNLATGADTVYNNTIAGIGNNTPSGCYGGPGTGSTVFKNNIVTSCDHSLNGLDDSANTYASGSPDYNLYANGNTNTFVVGSPPSTPSQCTAWGGWYSFSAFTDWQQCTIPAADAHSQAVANALLNSDGTLQSGSPAIGAGTNLTSICSGQPNPGLGALCSDINGTARPATGAWDAGAYQFSSSPQPVVGDLNADGHVNIFDLSIFLSHWQQSGTGLPEDFNSDGVVNIFDLSILLSHYGT